MTQHRALPKSRIARFSKLGQLAGGILSGVVSEGVRRISQGEKPAISDLVLTPQNFQRISDRLAEMRGAAMKIGQLLSMESGEFIPPELNQILSRLRENAYYMPLGKVAIILNQAWGKGWEENFSRFKFTPIASASIGQVHDAELNNGSRLAIKIQYPGIRQSINSDVKNVAGLLKIVNLLPKEIDFAPLIDEAKKQLHQEADYIAEAQFLKQFATNLADDCRFEVPTIIESMSTREILVMSYLEGEPIEKLSNYRSMEVRNNVCSALLELSMLELFEWGLVQTDPNFANYRFNEQSGRIQLLDFGATRVFTKQRRDAIKALITAAVNGNESDILHSAEQVGYLKSSDPPVYQQGIVELVKNACEPVIAGSSYDFATSDLASRMASSTMQLRVKEKFGRLPPPEILFLHRKIAGLYLLFNRLKAVIPVNQIVTAYLK